MKLTGRNQGAISDRLSQRIAGRIIKVQSRLADFLNERTRKCSYRKLLLGFIGFFILFGAYCLYLILTAIN